MGIVAFLNVVVLPFFVSLLGQERVRLDLVLLLVLLDAVVGGAALAVDAELGTPKSRYSLYAKRILLSIAASSAVRLNPHLGAGWQATGSHLIWLSMHSQKAWQGSMMGTEEPFE